MVRTRFGQCGVGGRIFTVEARGEKRLPVPLIQPEARHNTTDLIPSGQTAGFNSASPISVRRGAVGNSANLTSLGQTAADSSASHCLPWQDDPFHPANPSRLGRDGSFRPVSPCLLTPGGSCRSESAGLLKQDKAFRTERAIRLKKSETFRHTNPLDFQGNRPFFPKTVETCAKVDSCALDGLNFRLRNPIAKKDGINRVHTFRSGRDAALRRPRRRAQRQAAETSCPSASPAAFVPPFAFAPGGDSAARCPYRKICQPDNP